MKWRQNIGITKANPSYQSPQKKQNSFFRGKKLIIFLKVIVTNLSKWCFLRPKLWRDGAKGDPGDDFALNVQLGIVYITTAATTITTKYNFYAKNEN